MQTNKLGIVLLLLNVLVFICTGVTGYFIADNLFYTISLTDAKVEAYKVANQQQTDELKTFVIDSTRLTSEVDKKQMIIEKAIISYLSTLDTKITDLNATLHPLSIANIEEIKEANLYMVNVSKGAIGAGTHIRIKNQDYVLSVAHLIENPDDIMYALDNKGTRYGLELIKINVDRDLSLFKIDRACPDLASLEISEENPKEGSEVILIGNPNGDSDIVTEGIIAHVGYPYYTTTNISYFGNSGGALIYKGKVIGVASQLSVLAEHPPVYVNYCSCVTVDLIREFLAEFTK